MLGTVNLDNRTCILDQRLGRCFHGVGLTRPRGAEEEKVSNGARGCHDGEIHLIMLMISRIASCCPAMRLYRIASGLTLRGLSWLDPVEHSSAPFSYALFTGSFHPDRSQ